MLVLNLTALLCLALLTGNEFCVAAFVEPTLRSLPDAEQMRTVPRFAGILGKFMPPWYAATLLLTLAATVARSRHGAGWVNGAAVSFVLQLIVLAITLAFLVPRNSRLARMTTPYPRWQADAHQWDQLHRLRVALLLLATIALAVA